ncbi:MAG: PAS domain S-box protein [Methanomassiliicoccales archaeon]
MIRLLAVDDEPEFLELTKVYMEEMGDFEVDTASSVREAWERLSQERYEVVVSDYQMEGENGIEFLEALRKEGVELPFILFTGKGREEVAIRALNAGADFYLEKGGDPRTQYTELCSMVSHAVSMRRAERAMEENSVWFQALIENSSDVVVVMDREGNIDYASPSVRTVLHLEGEELLGTGYMERIPEGDKEVIREGLAMLARGEDPPDPEFSFLDGRGQWIILEARARTFPLESMEGKIIVNARDVTSRRRAERERVRALRAMESSVDGMAIMDDRGHIIHCNEALASLYGWDREDLIGVGWRRLYTPEEVERLKEEGVPVLRKEGHWRGEAVGRRRDGSTFPQEVTFTETEDGLVCVIRDMSEWKNGRRRLVRLNRMLRTIREINQFIAREDDRERLIRGVTSIVAREKDPHRAAWIGLIDADGRMEFVAGTGVDLEKLDPLDRAPRCFSLVLEEQSPYLIGDFSEPGSPCLDCPLRDCGGQEKVLVRLERGKTFGVMVISSDAGVYSEPEELELIEEIGGDLGLALSGLEMGEKNRRAHEFNTALVESMKDGVAVLDGQGVHTFVNESFRRMTGFGEEELIGQGLPHPYWPEGRVQEYMDRMRITEEGWTEERRLEFCRKDGTVFPVLVSPGLIRDDRGRIVRHFATVKDLSQLQDVEERFRTVFESASDAIVIHDLQGRILEANRSAQELLGYSGEEIQGMNIVDVRPSGFDAGIDDLLDDLDGSRAPPFEGALMTREGTEIPVEVSGSYIYLNGQQAVLGVVRDISERKRVEYLMERQAEEQEMLLDSIDIQIWYLIDPETHGIANLRRAQFLGMPKGDIQGTKIWEIERPKEEMMVCLEGNRRAFQGERVSQEERVTDSLGNKRTMLVTKIPQTGEEGEVEYVVCSAQDITEMKEAERALWVSKEKLNLLGSITRHDILNHLSVIVGYKELMEGRVDDPKLRHYLAKMDESASRIRRLFDFQRDYEMLGESRPEWMRLDEVVAATASEMDLGEVELEVDLRGVEVYADPMISKVFSNLMANSLKHGGEVERIRIFTEESEEFRIVYQDDGVGIPEKEKEIIFERGQGRYLGHGLFLVREVLSMTGMEIRENGTEGARFEIVVPPSMVKR